MAEIEIEAEPQGKFIKGITLPAFDAPWVCPVHYKINTSRPEFKILLSTQPPPPPLAL